MWGSAGFHVRSTFLWRANSHTSIRIRNSAVDFSFSAQKFSLFVRSSHSLNWSPTSEIESSHLMSEDTPTFKCDLSFSAHKFSLFELDSHFWDWEFSFNEWDSQFWMTRSSRRVRNLPLRHPVEGLGLPITYRSKRAMVHRPWSKTAYSVGPDLSVAKSDQVCDGKCTSKIPFRSRA